MTVLITLLLSTLFSAVPSLGAAQEATGLARTLEGGDWDAKLRTVQYELLKPPHSLSGVDRRALAFELSRLTRAFVSTNSSSLLGSVPATFEFVEYWHLSALLLSRQEGPEIIAPLVSVLSSGGPVVRVVRDLGEAAVPALIAEARSASGLLGHTEAALNVLEQMYEVPSIGAMLSESSRAETIAVASDRMENAVGNRNLFASAACLGIAARDPSIRAAASALIDNPPALSNKGIINESDILFVSERLRQAFAKFP